MEELISRKQIEKVYNLSSIPSIVPKNSLLILNFEVDERTIGILRKMCELSNSYATILKGRELPTLPREKLIEFISSYYIERLLNDRKYFIPNRIIYYAMRKYNISFSEIVDKILSIVDIEDFFSKFLNSYLNDIIYYMILDKIIAKRDFTPKYNSLGSRLLKAVVSGKYDPDLIRELTSNVIRGDLSPEKLTYLLSKIYNEIINNMESLRWLPSLLFFLSQQYPTSELVEIVKNLINFNYRLRRDSRVILALTATNLGNPLIFEAYNLVKLMCSIKNDEYCNIAKLLIFPRVALYLAFMHDFGNSAKILSEIEEGVKLSELKDINELLFNNLSYYIIYSNGLINYSKALILLNEEKFHLALEYINKTNEFFRSINAYSEELSLKLWKLRLEILTDTITDYACQLLAEVMDNIDKIPLDTLSRILSLIYLSKRYYNKDVKCNMDELVDIIHLFTPTSIFLNEVDIEELIDFLSISLPKSFRVIHKLVEGKVSRDEATNLCRELVEVEDQVACFTLINSKDIITMFKKVVVDFWGQEFHEIYGLVEKVSDTEIELIHNTILSLSRIGMLYLIKKISDSKVKEKLVDVEINRSKSSLLRNLLIKYKEKNYNELYLLKVFVLMI
ncbi:hypothetical protein GO599_02060 [Sulfolobus islandicus]|uniref:hypothetical protein n=1 Tax=Saccharolobus islandicus TaxID=43080 RepID=UPI00234B6805|nr:hypothetical protein [Sulfolobus islandicus]WCM36435.1 hypothetical protein GO599_02060 [Sulfolobus islandicus]